MTTTPDGRWHAGIGDPNATGWITVAAYATAMLLCYLCQRRSAPGPQRQFWLLMVLIMAVLGLNKQLDLQTWLTEVGRDLALEHGWYRHRRLVQAIFIACLLVAGVAVGAWLAYWLRALDVYARRAAYGLVVLGVFILVRASSFHHIDVLLGLAFENVRLNAVLELSGICAIVHSAWGRWRSPPDNRRT
ncbi:MAG: hypothetical protein V4858_12630 [Pseudomonadota bacterium]